MWGNKLAEMQIPARGDVYAGDTPHRVDYSGGPGKVTACCWRHRLLQSMPGFQDGLHTLCYRPDLDTHKHSDDRNFFSGQVQALFPHCFLLVVLVESSALARRTADMYLDICILMND